MSTGVDIGRREGIIKYLGVMIMLLLFLKKEPFFEINNEIFRV